MPDPAALGDVAALGRVDGVEVADALAVLGILAVGDVDDVVRRSTGVLIISLRVFGQTESFGLVSNSQSFLPVSAS